MATNSREYMAAYREKNHAKLKERQAAYYQEHRAEVLSRVKSNTEKNKEKRAEYSRKYRKDNREYYLEYIRAYDLKRTYGITADQYDDMLEAQGGVCAICGKAQEGRRLFVDHDHDSGHVRGLLCHYCNFGIGHFFDDPGLLIEAAEYLRKAGKL